MANSRLVASDTFEDEFYLALDMLGRNLWIGLIVRCADDQGRLQDNPILIKSQVFPADNVTPAQVENILREFSGADRILRYTSSGKKVIQILNWWKHQHPSWAAASRYPAPTGWTDRIKVHGKGTQVNTLNWDNPGGFVLGSALPNQLPKGINDVNGKGNVNGDGDGDGDGDDEGAKKPPTPPASIHGDYVIRVISQVTGLVSIPDDKEKVLPALEGLYYQRDKDEAVLVEYLKPFYQAWIARHYRKTNFAWLYQWAVAGEIPEPSNNGSKTGKQVDTSLDDLIRSGK